MTFRDLWDFARTRDREWRFRGKSLALWIAGAQVGDNLTDGDDAFAELLESES